MDIMDISMNTAVILAFPTSTHRRLNEVILLNMLIWLISLYSCSMTLILAHMAHNP